MATKFTIKELEKKIKESKGTRWEQRYRTMLYEKRAENLRKKIEKASSGFGASYKVKSGAKAGEVKKDLDKLYKGLKDKGKSESYSKGRATRYANEMGKAKRSYESERRYYARDSKVREGLKNITKEQRIKAAQKAKQTRKEKKEFKEWWSKLSHGEKVKYGREQARIKKEKRRAAYRKGVENRENRKKQAAAEFLNKQINRENENFKKSQDSFNREKKTVGSNTVTDEEELVGVFIKYGKFANEKLTALLEKNASLRARVERIEKGIRVAAVVGGTAKYAADKVRQKFASFFGGSKKNWWDDY